MLFERPKAELIQLATTPEKSSLDFFALAIDFTTFFQDVFVKRSVEEGYRSRSAYKLLQMQSRFKFLTNCSSVVSRNKNLSLSLLSIYLSIYLHFRITDRFGSSSRYAMLMETTRKCPAHSKIFRILVSSSSKSYELIECQRISYYWRRRERQALVNLLFIYLFIYLFIL